MLLMFVMSSYGQTLVWDWSPDYAVSESSMAIGIAESSIDQITVQGNTFPVGGVIGVFYQNAEDSVVCAGSTIWDYQSNVIPVWGGDQGLLEGQSFALYAFVNGSVYIADNPVLDSEERGLRAMRC